MASPRNEKQVTFLSPRDDIENMFEVNNFMYSKELYKIKFVQHCWNKKGLQLTFNKIKNAEHKFARSTNKSFGYHTNEHNHINWQCKINTNKHMLLIECNEVCIWIFWYPKEW